jgi:hypothetical protein
MSINITAYDEFQAKVDEIKEACDFIPDVSTEEGYSKSKRIALDTRKVLTAIEKKRKKEKEQYIQAGKDVDAKAKAIDALIRPLMLPHDEAYKKLDQDKKDREAKRVAELEEKVQHIRSLPELMAGMDSTSIMAALESLQNETCEGFYEFTESALKNKNESIDKLAALHSETLKKEHDAKELENLRKEKEERDRIEYEERIKREASEKAEKEKQAAIEREQQAKQQAKEAEERRLISEKQAAEDKVKAEEKAKAMAEQAAENARLEEVRKQEQKVADEKKALEQRQANNRYIGKTRKEAKECLMNEGLDENTAKKIVLAIHNGKIKNVFMKV